MIGSQTEVWSFGRLLNWTAKYLADHGSESPRLDAEVLLAHAVPCPRIALYTRFNEPAAEAVRARFRQLVQERAGGKPVAYLVGHKEFFSLEFEVTPDVLIPRPDSEFVVLEFLRLFSSHSEVTAVDVGTGSGNLAVAAACQHAGVRFWATDVSGPALEVAQRNARRHQVDHRIEFCLGNLLEPLPVQLRCDCIMSNPPYIASAKVDELPPGVRCHEPRVALDGGPSGMEVVTELVRQVPKHLKPGGQLILEISDCQEQAVRQLIADQGCYDLLPTVHDYAGYPRVLSARFGP